ncbi:MAG: alkaline phosphatase family protein [Nanoarchaeota archaeon]
MVKVLLLFLDAFRHDLVTRENTPFLYKLSREGIFGNLNTLAGYHVEYSMFSGCLPTKHHVWTWYGLSKNSDWKWTKPFIPIFLVLDNYSITRKIIRNFISYYSMGLRKLKGKSRFMMVNRIPLTKLWKFQTTVDRSYIDKNPLRVPTLFDVLRKNKKKYLAYDYPTKATHIKTSLYTSHGDDVITLNKLKKSLKKDYDLRFAHVWNLDSLQHKHGTDSNEVRTHLRKLDTAVKELLTEARKKEPTTVMIFADHGMSKVEKTVNPFDVLKNYKGKVECFVGSTLLNIWFKDKTLKKELTEKFERLGCYVYDKNNIKSIKIPYDHEIVGDIMIAVGPGGQFWPDYFRKDAIVKAMHGYTVKTKDQDGIFIVNGPNINKKKLKNVQLVDITPTVLKLFGLDIPKACDGIARFN